MPLLKKWGCTGLLIEYEDTFPYDGDLNFLACSEAYSKQNIGELLLLAERLELDVIPLVQTFGHLEVNLREFLLLYIS